MMGVLLFGVLFAAWVGGMALYPKSRGWGNRVSWAVAGLMGVLVVLMLLQVVPPWGFGTFGPGPGPGGPPAPTAPAVPPVRR